MLAEAGVPEGFETTLWAIPVPRPYMPNGEKVAEAIIADLSRVGIQAKMISYDWGTYLDKTDHGEHDMALLGWSGDNCDPDNFLYILLDKDAATVPATNIAFYRSDPLHEILVRAKTTVDRSEREELYLNAQRIIHEDAPWVPLAHVLQVVVMGTHVRGFTLHPTTRKIFRDAAISRD